MDSRSRFRSIRRLAYSLAFVGAGLFIGLLGTAAESQAQVPEPGSKLSLLKNGVYAAGFGEVSVHNGTLFDVSTTTIGARLGWQIIRYPWVAASIGYAAFGLGLDPFTQSEDLKKFRFNVEGVQWEAYIMPDSRIYGAIHYILGNGRVNYEDENVVGGKIESSFRSQEYGGAVMFRAWRYITAVAGFGLRMVDPAANLEDAPFNFEESSSSYFYLGTRASIL